LYESADPDIYYSIFANVIATGIVPAGTVIIIDEFHNFMKLPAQLTAAGISCPYKFASAQQVLGLSATFGGK
jgi:hypothetical protein